MSLSKEREKVIREHAEYCIDCLGSHGENITVELLAEIDALRAALEPFAKIYDVFLDNGLDECRPDWGPVSDDYEVYCGRGGKRLITIGDLKAAKKAFGKQGE